MVDLLDEFLLCLRILDVQGQLDEEMENKSPRVQNRKLVAYNLRIKFGQAWLPLIIEDQNGVDHSAVPLEEVEYSQTTESNNPDATALNRRRLKLIRAI